LIKALKAFQENLGEFQDLAVQQDHLHRFGEQMSRELSVPPQTLMAMEMLVQQMEGRKHEVREEFAERFHHFALPENKKRFKSLFSLPETIINPSP